ncbi:hypothetical protein Hdeb2414_s0005g00169851 [Helianthus debilis subsp. tardiflorus]
MVRPPLPSSSSPCSPSIHRHATPLTHLLQFEPPGSSYKIQGYHFPDYPGSSYSKHEE